MASNSKKRRRVLGASCILAALIIASSSFAWFTSKDEVTNRLTATADYGVSIVESYTPPIQWTPGETVEKDVYAVNTGSVDAFVKENISGKITVEYENTVGMFGEGAYDYVKLTDKEVELTKAGGYLVWNDASVENGPFGTDFTPTKAGNYVFRRAVEDNSPLATNSEKYALEGFYFNGTDYYKIRIANYKTGSEDHQRTPVTVKADGTLSAAPDIKYVVTNTDTAEPVAMYYETTGDGTKRLVATYKVDPAAAVNYDQNALAARHAVEVANALGDYNIAKYKQDVAQKEYDLINGLVTERNTLVEAAKTYKDKVAAVDTATNGTNGETAKQTAVANVADGTLTLQTKAPYNSRVLTSSDTNYALYPQAVKDAMSAFEIQYEKVYKIADESGYQKAVLDAFDEVQASVASAADDTTIDGKVTTLNNAYNTLVEESEKLYKAYYDIVTAATSSGLDLDTAGLSAYKKLLGDENQANSYMEQVADYKSNIDALTTAVDEYKAARDAREDAESERDSAFSGFNTAVNNYQTNVAGKINQFKTDVGDLQDIFEATNNLSGTGITHYTGEDIETVALDETNATGFLYQVENNADYYLADFDTTAEYDPNEAVPAKIATNKTAAETLGAKAATTAPTEDAFKLNLDNANDTLADLKGDAAAKKLYYDNKNAETVGALPAATDIKIYINLDKDVETNWTMDPKKADIDTADEAKETVSFYLNSILEAGETSAKLIDSVTLDPATTNVFKNLVFDLDVTLDSAQTTYSADQTAIQTDAVKANNSFTLKPTQETYASVDDAVAWQ